ncbi:MAG: hypothetical protein CMF52_03935, partial [Legionellales bacterium]|nr:hypothetical protein [Legionellales bacterium]
MNDTITIKEFALENNVKPRTMPTRLLLASKKGVVIYPVGKKGKSNLYTRSDLTKANDSIGKNSINLTKRVKKVNSPAVVVDEDYKSMAAAILKINARSGVLNGKQMDFLI